MAKGFRNYNFTFDKNEKRILETFCKQIIKQTEGNQKLYVIEKAFSSVLEKLRSGEEEIKLTKEEYLRIQENMRENIRGTKERAKKAMFFMRWIYNSMLKQYELIYNTHFKD